MKITVAKTIYETVDIDDKFAPVLERAAKNEFAYTDEEEELWNELIDFAEKNAWYAGYSTDKKNTYWEL